MLVLTQKILSIMSTSSEDVVVVAVKPIVGRNLVSETLIYLVDYSSS